MYHGGISPLPPFAHKFSVHDFENFHRDHFGRGGGCGVSRQFYAYGSQYVKDRNTEHAVQGSMTPIEYSASSIIQENAPANEGGNWININDIPDLQGGQNPSGGWELTEEWAEKFKATEDRRQKQAETQKRKRKKAKAVARKRIRLTGPQRTRIHVELNRDHFKDLLATLDESKLDTKTIQSLQETVASLDARFDEALTKHNPVLWPAAPLG